MCSVFCLCVVQEQASWVCQCDESVVQRLEQDFKMTLQQQSSLDQWAAWLDSVVSQVLKPHEGSPSFPRAARQFLLKWSFYRYTHTPAFQTHSHWFTLYNSLEGARSFILTFCK